MDTLIVQWQGVPYLVHARHVRRHLGLQGNIGHYFFDEEQSTDGVVEAGKCLDAPLQATEESRTKLLCLMDMVDKHEKATVDVEQPDAVANNPRKTKEPARSRS